ncbi:beta-phosphoglucomutase [Galdieria sulphuraria]|uniref:Beta-phosphoglucomutase n=1 Tax=Galdieria sulphuraria TaxID=130081 RepID=M2Y7A1_GALSU|nr:beta-phosphoglucomutase [Galdieria sulphuraria]EME31908.1 beta-phosphoglucomutase [Galdieria sulphuraria]|eukprot:XP_005708428.1 beta-phosphoglucomutase [Galdieria sulphuraria]
MTQCSFCIVFDCDGVLVNSEPWSCESLRQAILKATGVDIPHQFPEDFYEVFGLSVYSSVEHYVKKGFLPADTNIDWVSRKVDEHKDAIYQELARGKLSTFPGLKALLQEASVSNIHLGVGSSGTPEKIEFNLREAGILSYFKKEYIVSSTQVAKGKPAPDVYLEVLKRINCPPEQSVVIEDACAGLLAAKNAGACAIGIATSLPREVLEPFADIVFDSFEEMSPNLLERIAKERYLSKVR